VVGGDGAFVDEASQEGLSDLRVLVRPGYRYAERLNRFLYGSDWPLTSMAAYGGFARTLIPPDYHDLVFCDNAHILFRLSA
jgi:predicted TIM-barrel fold metal-dependent hydrolase